MDGTITRIAITVKTPDGGYRFYGLRDQDVRVRRERLEELFDDLVVICDDIQAQRDAAAKRKTQRSPRPRLQVVP